MPWDEVTAVCLDLGGTVIREGRRSATRELAELLGVPFVEMRDYLARGAKRRRMAPHELAARVAADHGRPQRAAAVERLLRRRLAAARHPVPYADAPPALAALRRRGYRLAFLSDVLGPITPRRHSDVLLRLADTVALSCDTGWVKPERQAFAAVERAMSVPVERLVHVGDSWDVDVVGALAAGWRAVYVRRDTATGPPIDAEVDEDRWREVRHLGELLDLLPSVPGNGVRAESERVS